MLFAGAALGILTTWITMRRGIPGGISNGPWKTNLTAGSAQSDPYHRALIAIHGLFALNQSEAIYFTASADADGRALDGHCIYEITGHDPDARWWSITAYGADDYLIPNPAHRYAVSKTDIRRDASGNFAVQVGGDSGGVNWIPVAPGRFSLSLRLYNPGPSVVRDPARSLLPVLKKMSCS